MPLMPQKPRRHRCRCRWDWGRRRRRLTNGMDEDGARREDDTTTNKRQCWRSWRGGLRCWQQPPLCLSSLLASSFSGTGIALISGEKRLILCVTEKNTKKAIPILERGLPELDWVGISQYSKTGSPRSSMGLIPIWGLAYTGTWIFEPSIYLSGYKIK